jgi:CRP/FNR family transcriptional regulator
MTELEEVREALSFVDPNLVAEILEVSTIQDIPKDLQILREGQYVKVIPIVLKGLIKVFTSHQDKELLLYYIKPNESCVMSFAAALDNKPSKVFAITDEDTRALLIPIDKTPSWIKQFPDLNSLFFSQYNTRYTDLLETINSLLFDKLDVRLYNYLKEKAELSGKNQIKLSHREIANELGTAREVISRVMKKLENEGKVKQHSSSVEVF